ncbi:MAG TPA: hypothetical protein PKD54_06500 [Pirellulaceae bacterium]|nr:hypothetical protein [Pirellulaceae bacterium]
MRNARISLWIVVSGLCCLIMAAPGCGYLAQMLYVIKGHKVKAECNKLEGKKVAVVCVSDSAAYGPDRLTQTVARAMAAKLSASVKKVQMVSQAKVENWMDLNGWTGKELTALGQGVGAEMLVVIDMRDYTIHDGQTLYKGQSHVSVTVYDMTQGGQVVFSFGPIDHVFPKTGRPAIQTSDRQFEAFYLARLTDHLSRLFYDTDRLDEVAEDAMMNSF